MFDYDAYIQQKGALSFDEAVKMYQVIALVLRSDNEELHEYWGEVIKAAIDYTTMRVQWNYFSRDEKIDQDELRTQLHNTFITNLKVFFRFGQVLELDTSWMERLGPEEDRKRWGDFAGYLLCIDNLKAR